MAGLLVNVSLAMGKLVAGVLGNSYALIADAVESLSDIVGSAILYGGLRVAARPASREHPYGFGKAEPLAALAVAMIVLGAGVMIAVEAVREIITPHHTPAWWTLPVLVAVVLVKEVLFRVVRRRARLDDSTALETDAFHHRADAITSAAALVGISIALVGRWQTGDDTWAPADDWAALFASGIIIFNAVRLATSPLRELLDVQADAVASEAKDEAARVPGVVLVQKAFARKSGVEYWVDMHVWVEGSMSVREAHRVAHRVKDAVRARLPRVRDVLVHLEPSAEPPKEPSTVPSTAPSTAPFVGPFAGPSPEPLPNPSAGRSAGGEA